MKIKTKNLVVLLVIVLVFPSILTFNFNFNKKDEPNIVNPKVSGGYFESFIHVVAANWTTTRDTKNWCTGSGTSGDPFVIENVTIDASNSPTGIGIWILSSPNDYFIIRNCTVYNAPEEGIRLHNTKRGTIFNNTCVNNVNYGIMLYFYSNDNTIYENIIINNQDIGIYLSLNCYNNKITNNDCINNTFGGLSLWNNCGFNNITGNLACENDDEGIYLDQSCDNNTISGNTVIGNEKGIVIFSSDNNTITDNTVIENLLGGIYLQGSISYSSSENNTITGNTVSDNYEHGIKLQNDCHFNNITGNTINDNNLIGLYLQTTNDNNTIKNNTINRNDLGIGLVESDFNNVSENILEDNNWCILEVNCIGNNISSNDCTTPIVHEPIIIDGTATGVGANNWTWAINQGLCTGSGTSEVPYVIENLLISGFGIMNGIEIWNSNKSFIIRHCDIYNSKTSGIYLRNVSNGQLIENNCSNNLGGGILLSMDCLNNNITQNIANNNDGNGIFLYKECYFNEIIMNVANENDNNGIIIGDLCDNNTISNNIVSNNGESGIELVAGGLHSSYNNTISQNAVSNNEYGLQLQEDCHFHKISENLIKGNNIGILLKNLGCSNNSIYENFFVENIKHAIDDGVDNKWNITTIGNYWDNWTNPDANDDGIVDNPYIYIGGGAGSIDYLPIAEPSIGINSPSTGDVFGTVAPSFDVTITYVYSVTKWYTLDGGLHNYTFTENGMINQSAWDASADGDITLKFYASDIVGIMGSSEVSIIKDTLAPVIIINSPTEGEKFGKTAPLFNISVDDDNLDAIWYSFDGGLTTYAITNNTILNQTAWTILAQGNVTITFYASDLAGNKASESVTVIKSVPSGLDPTIIIVIVVVSVVGGVAVISVVYIFMKKRATPV